MNNNITLQSILDDVCTVFKIDASKLRSSNRAVELVASRMIFSYVASLKTKNTLKQMSEVICRHHSSAINHIKKVTGFLRYNDEMFIKHWVNYLENSKLFSHYDFGYRPPLCSQEPCVPHPMQWEKLTLNHLND